MELASALQAVDPAAAVGVLLTEPTFQAIDTPEVMGTASLLVKGTPILTQQFRSQRDTLRPRLMPEPTWIHVPLDGTAVIEVKATDEDLQNHDPIGSFVISTADLNVALNAGKVLQLKAADQTQRAILFAGILVIRE
jgi:hypothetical protein